MDLYSNGVKSVARKRNLLQLILVASILILLSLPITSCENIFAPRQVELALQGDYPHIPKLTGPGESIEILNKNLASELDDLCTVISNLQQTSTNYPTIHYSLQGERPSFILQASISIPDGERLYDISYKIDVDTGEVRLQNPSLEDPLNDADFLYQVLHMGMKGSNIPLEYYRQPVNVPFLSKLLVDIYEDLAGHEIDTTNIIDTVNPMEQKALALDLFNASLVTQDEYDLEDIGVVEEYAIDTILRWHERIFRDLYGKSTQPATVQDAWDLISLASKLTNSNWANSESLEEIEKLMTMDQPLTRLNLAQILVIVEENRLGKEIEHSYLYRKEMSDTKDLYAKKVDIQGLLPRYYDNNAFYPDKILQYRQLYEPILSFINMVCGDRIDEWENVTFQEVLKLIWATLDTFESYDIKPYREKLVINERPYDWYIDQANTGQYSHVNCMPACMEMVLKWRDPSNSISTEQLRNQYICDGHGWYDIGLANQLDAHNIPHTLETEFTLEIILSHLDNGNILIAMYNNGDREEGHAVVVKGYRQIPAGTWLICNDPSSFMPINKYGNLDGIGREKEAQELLWEMERHSSFYFVIPPADY